MNRLQLSALLAILWGSVASDFDIIELNYDIGTHSPIVPLPVDIKFRLRVLEAGYSRGYWFAYSEITTQKFVSTYLSAPYTLYEFGIKLDEIPFRDLFATAAVIDVRDKVAKNDFYEVSVEDVKEWIEKNGMFPPHCIVLFNTGWDQGRYPDQVAYFGTADDLEKQRFPGVSLEAMEFILNHEKTHGIYFVGVGIDAPQLDYAKSEVAPAQQLISKLNKYLIGNMMDLKRLPPKGAKIMTMPMKIKNGEGSPTRVAARIPRSY